MRRKDTVVNKEEIFNNLTADRILRSPIRVKTILTGKKVKFTDNAIVTFTITDVCLYDIVEKLIGACSALVFYCPLLQFHQCQGILVWSGTLRDLREGLTIGITASRAVYSQRAWCLNLKRVGEKSANPECGIAFTNTYGIDIASQTISLFKCANLITIREKKISYILK